MTIQEEQSTHLIILTDNLNGTLGKVQGERDLGSPEIVDRKQDIVRQVVLFIPVKISSTSHSKRGTDSALTLLLQTAQPTLGPAGMK